MQVETRVNWLASLLSTEPADRPRIESHLGDFYAGIGLPRPDHFFWFDSPSRAIWAMQLLESAHDDLSRRIVEGASRSKQEKTFLESIRAELCDVAGREWNDLASLAGTHLRDPWDIRLTPIRALVHRDVDAALEDLDEEDDLHRVEQHYREVMQGQGDDCYVHTGMEYSFYTDYRLAYMALDEESAAALGRGVPPALRAAWNIAQGAGYWWPLRRVVLLMDRPANLKLNDTSYAHCQDGPAGHFRDGTPIWAWNGFPMKEQWILHPEEIRASTLATLEPTFIQHVKKNAKPAAPQQKAKSSAILKQALPADAEARVALLRDHNRGKLPLWDRYMAGEYRQVWDELAALGRSVRKDPHAADALAVAYETMRRVAANVQTISARLKALGYEKKRGRLHQPAGPEAHKLVARLEKMAGPIPFSLRAFYEVVGAVDWTGQHPNLAPQSNLVTPDPLVVEPVEIVLEYWDEDEDGAGAIIIAPDEVFKAGEAGGDTFQIDVPNGGADGKLQNESHDVNFVEYLRVAFRFGGFPGYDGIDPLPPEIAGLCEGLLEF